MTDGQRSCPQCGEDFHFGDGLPDLYGVRVCSFRCHEIWLHTYHYRGVPDERAQQFGDMVTSPQVGDLPPLEDPRKQME